MPSTVDISIIIVTWNSQDWIQRCLRSIYQQTSDVSFEVVVVDNASSDKTIQMIMNQFANVSVVPQTKNTGFAAAVNAGLYVSSGRYVCVLNPDTEVQDRAIERMVAFMDKNADIGVLGPQLRNEDGSIQPSVRRFPTGRDQALIMTKLHLLFPDAPSLSRYLWRDFDYQRAQDVEQIMGACMCIRREVIDAIGRFDAKFFIWFEDVDYCYRVRTATSYRIIYEPSMSVVHYGGDSFDRVPNAKKQRWYRRSVRRYMLKHKRWSAVILLWLVTPASYITGLVASFVLRTHGGRSAEQQHKSKRKHL